MAHTNQLAFCHFRVSIGIAFLLWLTVYQKFFFLLSIEQNECMLHSNSVLCGCWTHTNKNIALQKWLLNDAHDYHWTISFGVSRNVNLFAIQSFVYNCIRIEAKKFDRLFVFFFETFCPKKSLSFATNKRTANRRGNSIQVKRAENKTISNHVVGNAKTE